MPLNVSVSNFAIDKEFCFVLVCQKGVILLALPFSLTLSPICSQWTSLPSPDWDLPLLINERYLLLLEEDSGYTFSLHDATELNAECKLFLKFEFRYILISKVTLRSKNYPLHICFTLITLLINVSSLIHYFHVEKKYLEREIIKLNNREWSNNNPIRGRALLAKQ